MGLTDVRLSTERLRQTISNRHLLLPRLAPPSAWTDAGSAPRRPSTSTVPQDGPCATLSSTVREDLITLDLSGSAMEYAAFRGRFDVLPRAMLLDVFAQHYPRMGALGGVLEQDVAREGGWMGSVRRAGGPAREQGLALYQARRQDANNQPD